MGTDAVAGAHGQNAREIIVRVRAAARSRWTPSRRDVALRRVVESRQDDRHAGAGYEADIVARHGDPLTDITAVTNVVFVMKGGKVFRR